jgi:hypothetical protein
LCLHRHAMGWPLPFTERWHHCLTFCPTAASQSDLCCETGGNTSFLWQYYIYWCAVSPCAEAVFNSRLLIQSGW